MVTATQVRYAVTFAAGEAPHVWTGKSLTDYVQTYFEAVPTGELDAVRRRELIPTRVMRLEPGKRPVNVTQAVRQKLLGFTAGGLTGMPAQSFAWAEVKTFTPARRRELLYGKRPTGRQRKLAEAARTGQVRDEVRLNFAMALLTEGSLEAGGIKAFGAKVAAELK